MSNRWLTKPRMFLNGKTSAYIIKLSLLYIPNMLAGIKSDEQSSSRKSALRNKKNKIIHSVANSKVNVALAKAR